MTATATTRDLVADVRRVRVSVHGTVQGVGFRPFVFRLANTLDLHGFVRNDPAGVTIEVEGSDVTINRFLSGLVERAPRHSRIGQVVVGELEPTGAVGFIVGESGRGGPSRASVPADLCTCAECLRELFDPADRRYRYPFINCTACGPRFTIARGIPYDRALTTMASFRMCDGCQAEYDDPGDRRFHAQPNACPECGPRLTLRDAHGKATSSLSRDPVAAAADAIRDGAIVAVKGLGGYHLACRADDSSVVTRLRRRKHRDDKPFALMVSDLVAARMLVRLDTSETEIMTSDARPILLARTEPGALVAPEVAPGRDELGVMLPYTPLHHLLLSDVGGPLVMTSGNATDEPIAFRDDDALDRLGGIADLFLTHDRLIEAACEDSVVRVVSLGGERQTLFIRRSRGFVPNAIPSPTSFADGVLATGGQLKNTVCIGRESEAFVGPHCGDLGDAGARAAFTRGVEHLAQLVGATQTVVAHDLHPDYAATRYALDRSELLSVGVQHHHAHFAACLAEHGETGPAIGVIFDGTGYGTDGTIWGGEILHGDLGDSVRVGRLRAVCLPGGEMAVREPWRMACAWLTDALNAEPRLPPTMRDVVSETQWRAVSRLVRREGRSPVTTSMGRLLDACAAMCGIGLRVTYEAQAAIDFEMAARSHRRTRAHRNGRCDPKYENALAVTTLGDEVVIDPRELVRAIDGDVQGGRDIGEIASSVHDGLVYATRKAAELVAEARRSRTIVLSGGVFQNVLLLEAVASALATSGHRVLVPRRLPPNDGGLSYGQAVAAAWRRRADVSGDSRPNR